MDNQINRLEETIKLIEDDSIELKWKAIRDFIVSIDKESYYREHFKRIKRRRTREYLDEKWYDRLIYNYFVRHIHFVARKIYPDRDESTFHGPAFLSYYQETYKRFSDELINNWDFYDDLYKQLSDDKSRRVLVGITMGRLTGKKSYFGEVADPVSTQYFDQEVVGHVESGELFLDVGGFDGSSTEDFFSYSDGKVQSVSSIIYELDPKNVETIKERFADDARVEIRNKGLSDRKGKVYFESGASMSTIVDYETDEQAEVVRLDDDLERTITYMKMDVEGAEEGVLRGSKRHITNDRPRMAICVYHKPDDIRVFYDFVNSCRSDYKFYLRQYMPTESESVLYAIPE